jgi:hypothetical protein
MRWITILGVALVLLGLGGLFVNVIPYHHTEEVAKIGPLTATEDQETDYTIPRPLALFVAASGAVLIVIGQKRRA